MEDFHTGSQGFTDPLLGGTDGQGFFASLAETLS